MTNGTNYQPPIDRLLTFGDCYEGRNQWFDYITELGITSEHIPDLIRIAVDGQLNGEKEALAPIHAWRTLAQLGAKEAIQPLMELFHQWEDNDWVAEEMPKVYAALAEANPGVINGLQDYLAEESHGVFPRITSVNCLQEIGKHGDDLRSQCINVLNKQLKLSAKNPAELNGFIVTALIELQAVDSASIIYHAFTADVVPEDIVGTWDEVREVLGVNVDDLQPIIEDTPSIPEEVDNTLPTLTTEDVVVKEIESTTDTLVVETPSTSAEIQGTTDTPIAETPPTLTTEEVAVEEEIVNTTDELVEDTSPITTTEEVLIEEERESTKDESVEENPVTSAEIAGTTDALITETPQTLIAEDVSVEEFIETTDTVVEETVSVEEKIESATDELVEDTSSTPTIKDVVIEEEVESTTDTVIADSPTISVEVENTINPLVEDTSPVPTTEEVPEQGEIENTSTELKITPEEEIPPANLSLSNVTKTKQVKSDKSQQNMIEDLLAHKSSHKKTETDTSKGFGGDKSKSKTTKKKKR